MLLSSGGLIEFIIALLIAISIHEAAHAFVAYRLGDPTAKYAGRISLNPLRHLDFWGTMMFVFFHFGWGKPVLVNENNLKNPLRDGALISLAGPASNLLLSLMLALPIKYLRSYEQWWEFVDFLQIVLLYNLVLAIFNLLPFPPLDGSKIIGAFVPKNKIYLYDRYQENGMIYFILFVLFDSYFLSKLLGFSILSKVIFTLVDLFLSFIFLGS